MSRLFNNLFVRLLLFACFVLATGYCVYYGLWVWLVVLLPGCILTVRSLYMLYGRNARKVGFMLNAIENNDFSFRLSSSSGSHYDELVDDALNRITHLLYNARADAVQREKYYELIINSVSTGVVVLEDSGFVFQCNAEALKLLGLHVFTHVKQLEVVDESLRRVMETAAAGSKEHVSFVNERGTVSLSIRTSEMILKEKHVRILAINDINSELDEKELDSWIRLIRILTHEIMNSVTPIASLSETMLSFPQTADGSVREGLEAINTTCRGLLSFVDSYRRFTSVPAPKPSLFYLRKFADRMVQLAQSNNDYPEITVRISVQPEELILYADENLIGQVVLNLLRNAMQAIGSGRSDGEIDIRAYCGENESVIIEVSNNGPEIPADVAQHIFIPFFTTKEGGSGIGLSISRQIMRLSGGILSLKSSPGSHRTTFMLVFP